MKKNVKKAIAVIIAGSFVISSVNDNVYANAAKKVSITKKAKVTVGKSTVIKLKNNKKKVVWKVTKGTKCVKIVKKSKTSCTVKAVKSGNAVVQAAVGKKKYKCNITVTAVKKPEATETPMVTETPTQTPEVTETPTQTETPAVTPTSEPTAAPEETPTSEPTVTPDLSDIKTVVYDGTNSEEIKEMDKEGTPYKVVIKDGVTSIDSSIFEYCSGLTSVEIPNSVTSIKTGAFFDCESLTSIKVDENNPVYDSRENCNAIIETESNMLISGCKSTVIPDSVTGIEASAFVGCTELTSIEISDKITEIGRTVFAACVNLTSIKVDANNPVYDSREDCNAIIETKSNTLISGCKSTKIPNNVTAIGEGAFSGCGGLTNIEIPDSVTDIRDAAFSGCGLTSIEIPDKVTSLGWAAFQFCNKLESIKIPDSVTTIGDDAFADCDNLKNINWNGTTYSSADDFLTAFNKTH